MTKVMLQSNRERMVLSINVAKSNGYLYGKTLMTPGSQRTQKSISGGLDINVKGKIIKLLESSIREYHHDLRQTFPKQYTKYTNHK